MVLSAHKKPVFVQPQQTVSLSREQLEQQFNPHSNCTIFKDMLNHIGDELLLIDYEGNVVFANKAAEKGLKCPQDVLLTKRITDFFSPKINVATWQKKHFSVLKKDRKPKFSHLQRVTEKGEHQTMEVSAVYVAHQGGEFVLTIGRDITGRAKMEQELKKAMDFYQLLFAEAGDPILIFDLAGHVTYANQAAEEVFRLPVSKFVGKHYRYFVQKNSIPKIDAAFIQVKKSSSQTGVEVDTRNAKGEHIPFEVTFSPVEQNGKVVAVHTIGRDLRPRRQLENLLIQTEKMKAVQYSLIGTAGELRNPLWAVLQKIEDLVGKYHQRDFEYIGYREFKDIMDSLQSIKQQMKYCYQTSERLIGLNQKQLGRKKSFCDANEVILGVISLKEELFKERGVKHFLKLQPKLPKICIGVIDFNQVVNNVVSNALESILSGGTVNVRSSFVKKSCQVKIEVIDNGIGIATENIPHIYEPFFTTKQHGNEKNPGLGLTIVYSIISACHGEIKVESSLRQGTTITMFFPAKKESIHK